MSTKKVETKGLNVQSCNINAIKSDDAYESKKSAVCATIALVICTY